MSIEDIESAVLPKKLRKQLDELLSTKEGKAAFAAALEKERIRKSEARTHDGPSCDCGNPAVFRVLVGVPICGTCMTKEQQAKQQAGWEKVEQRAAKFAPRRRRAVEFEEEEAG